VSAQLAVYDDIVGPNEESEAFDSLFFQNMVLVLDAMFAHRSRGMEGKDGNPMNEVRLLCTSILENDSRLAADTSIKLKPETSVLGLQVGDSIDLTQGDFERLSGAFFGAIERTYT
jgi:hypothetical protein